LRPTAPLPVAPDGTRAPLATSVPVGAPAPVVAPGTAPTAAPGRARTGGTGTGDAAGAPTAAPARAGAPEPTGSARPARSGVPWSRGQEPADPERQARCLSSGADDTSAVGSRYGDWCLTATADRSDPGKVRLRLAACALSPSAEPLAFPNGREADFVVTAGERHVWSSATGRTFPAEPGMVKADYPMCTVWTLLWDARSDDGRAVGSGRYDLEARLRLTSAAPRHRTTVTV
ncbi:MAG TPA: BsuPI-related putative proteinase inhibitor, partial [Frankiaceae bacterium]|nr:BsuPI-related putative proteinase inhibitor [Frankiaceae bacterium]